MCKWSVIVNTGPGFLIYEVLVDIVEPQVEVAIIPEEGRVNQF